MKAFRIVIVIPAYREMNDLEKISLRQAVKILGQYKICLAVPAAMDVSNYLSVHDFVIERFDDSYFKSISAYSRLLLSTSFYERFKEYEYMLIYQLDAFVFHDILGDLCALGYDYYGAPWRLTDVGRIITGNPVGNGGVSLRNISHTIDVLHKYRETIQKKEKTFVYEQGEDVFFAWAGMQPNANYKTAPIHIAKMFSLECDVQHAFTNIKDHLPFAIHKWYQRDFLFWKPYIEKQGYTINEQDPHIKWRTTKDDRLIVINQYCIRRIIRHTSEGSLRKLIHRYIPLQREIYIYGKGRIGKRAFELLQYARVYVAGFIDKEALAGEYVMGIRVFQIQEVITRNVFVIIGSTAYEDEIRHKLNEYGLEKKTDFISYKFLENSIINDYYAKGSCVLDS